MSSTWKQRVLEELRKEQLEAALKVPGVPKLLLQRFALYCARQASQHTDDLRVHAAIGVIARYLNGDATKEELERALVAATRAAESAESAEWVAWTAEAAGAAEAASRAASAAAEAAARAAGAAEWAAAWAAGVGAAEAAEWAAQRQELQRMVEGWE